MEVTRWEHYARPDPFTAAIDAPQSSEAQEWMATMQREMVAELATLYEQGGAEAFERASGLVGRNKGAALLFDWYATGALTDADLPSVVADVWNGAEEPSKLLGVAQWVRFFRLAAYPPPTQPLTVYRGTTAGGRRGMSWTTDLEQARWFADRIVRMTGTKAEVVTVVAPPEAVLAIMDEVEPKGRMENEVVIDPRLLPRVRRLEIRAQHE